MSPVRQKRIARRVMNNVKRGKAGLSEEDLTRIEILAHALNANDDASFRLRGEIESILGEQTASGTEDRRATPFQMLTRH